MYLQGCLVTTSLVFMPKKTAADDQSARNNPHMKEAHGNQGVYRNALVFLSAHVLSHCGFLLSLLAIWLAWLVPTAILAQPAPDIKTLNSRTKPPRRPISLPSDVHRNIAPNIFPTNDADHRPARHVCFADASSNATIVKPATVSVPPSQATDIVQPSQTIEANPQLSVRLLSENASESLDSLVLESDSSSRPSSLKRSSTLNKFKIGLRSYSLDMTASEAASPLGITTFLLKSQQRASLPASKPAKRFPFRRCSVPVGQDPRTPKPIPRTMPYGAPYFATPPILLDNHYSKPSSTRPQLKDEILNSRAPDCDSELSRGRTIRRVSLSSTTDKLPKPRSTSTAEDLTSLNP